jgi:hypothetical protein
MSFPLRISLIALFLTSYATAIDRNAFAFIRYDLEFRTNPEEQGVAARGKITLRNDSAQPQKLATLQISSSLEWRMIEAEGKPLQYLSAQQTTDMDHTGKITEAVVTLPAPVPPQGTVELEVGYSGTVPKDATRLTRMGVPEADSLASDWDQVSQNYTVVRGIGHVAWYPISTDIANLSENSLFSTVAEWQAREADARMSIRFCWITDEDRSFTVVANGVFEGIGGGSSAVEGNRTGCTTYSFHDLSLTVPTFAIAPFEMLTRSSTAFYFLPGNEKAAMDYAVAAERVQPWVEEWLGKTKEKVTVVELPDANSVPFDSGVMLFTPLNKDQKVAELTMAHQLAHAAFRSPRRWMTEGLAQFAQVLVRERQDGRPAAIDFMAARLPALVAAEKQNAAAGKPSGDAAQSLLTSTDEVYYRVKAMYVWWMLRDLIGDRALQTSIAGYNPGQDKEPSYFQRLANTHGKRDLEWFFDDWVYRDRGLPDFKIATVFPRETLNGNFVVAVTVENGGGAGAEVPITVRTSDGEKSARMLVRAKQKEITRISVTSVPREVLVNDGSIPESDASNNRTELK